MAFEYFAEFNPTAFIANCLRSGMKQLLSRRLVQVVTVFERSLRFVHKDFIASFGIVFLLKCRPTEDVGMYFWLEIKMQGKYPQVIRCKATCCPLQSFSLLLLPVDDDLYRI